MAGSNLEAAVVPMPSMLPRPWLCAQIPSLWNVVTVDGEELLGYTTMFVDDGLCIGDPEAMMRVTVRTGDLECHCERMHGLGSAGTSGRDGLTIPCVDEYVSLNLRTTLQLDQHK